MLFPRDLQPVPQTFRSELLHHHNNVFGHSYCSVRVWEGKQIAKDSFAA